MEYNKEQRIICKKYNAPFVETFPFWKVGIARNVIEGTQPINGLRHLPKDDTSGWYIWAGEEFSNDRDFFVPLHAEHLTQWCPEIIKFLGLPAGYRFLYASNYEDVWEDKKLII